MRTRNADVSFSLVVPLALVVFVLLRGDPIYLGLWYYLTVPAVVVAVLYALTSPAFFVPGATFGLSATFLVYWFVQFQRAQPEGLLGLGHLFSVPGALLGLLIARYAVRAFPGIGPVWSFVLALVGSGLGFAAAQGVVCNTAMWCGDILSFMPVR